MLFSFGLMFFASLLYCFHYLVGVEVFERPNLAISFLMGLALIGMILSASCFFMNMGMYKLRKRKQIFIWMGVSIFSFLAYMSYVVICIWERSAAAGAVFI